MVAGTLWLCAALCLYSVAEAKARIPDVPQKVVKTLQKYMYDLFRYENPTIRDHFYSLGTSTLTKFSNFNFTDYRFDGYVSTVLTKQGYEYLIKEVPEAKNLMLPVYHGFHEDMKHNYFSKPWEPYFEGPVFYCTRRRGFVNATEPLWTLDGQPIDSKGDLGYDTIYTTHLIERDLPNVEDYVMYRVLCNTWTMPPNDYSVRGNKHFDGEQGEHDFFAHTYFRNLIYLYQFYNEFNQDHYYKLSVQNTTEDHANFKNVVAMLIAEKQVNNVSFCQNVTDLIPLIQAHNAKGSDHVLFLGLDKLYEGKKQYGYELTNIDVLGFVARVGGDEKRCGARYQLNIHIRQNNNLVQGGNNTEQGNDYHDRDVYIAPLNANSKDPLFLNQTFFIW